MLLSTRMNGEPSPLEQVLAKKKARPTQVWEPATDVDHVEQEGAVEPDVAKANPIARAIAAHVGARPVEAPTSPDTAPANPRAGYEAPGASGPAEARYVASRHPNSSSPAELASRPAGSDRAETPAPRPGVASSASRGTHRDHTSGRFSDGPAGHDTLDLSRQGGLDAARVFSRPNKQLPGRAANSPATGEPNVSTNER